MRHIVVFGDTDQLLLCRPVPSYPGASFRRLRRSWLSLRALAACSQPPVSEAPAPLEGRCQSADVLSVGIVPVQALALMAAFRDEWPCLIIVPPALRGAPPPHRPRRRKKTCIQMTERAGRPGCQEAQHRILNPIEHRVVGAASAD